MKKRLLPILLLGGVMLVQNASAQFSLSGQFRPRTEMRNGFKTPVVDGSEVSLFTEQRTRLIADYKTPSIQTHLSIQDVRIWGEVGQINKSDNLLSVHEAYASYNTDSLGKSKFIIGRQELVYDDHRVLGSLDWAAQGRSHDAVRYIYKDSDSTWELHTIATWNQDGTIPEPAKLQNAYTGPGGNNFNGGASGSFNLPNPKTALYVWFNTKLNGGKSGNISFLSMTEGYQETPTYVSPLQTFGINPTLKFGDIKLHAAFYYQLGKTADTIDIGGMLAHLELTHEGSSIKPTIGFDFLSGDDKSTGDKIEGFNPLHGTHHKFYGYMDYFYVGNGHNGGGNGLSGGLLDVYAKAAFPIGKSKLMTDVHFFMSPTDVTDPTDPANETLSSYLGTELDLVWVKKLKEGVTLNVGYSQMFHTSSMSRVKGKLAVDPVDATQTVDNTLGNQSWAWVMINFSPKFL